MPFVVLPRAMRLSEQQLFRLSARLCPYDEHPAAALENAHCLVLATSLARVGADRLTEAVGPGTAAFEVRVDEGALWIDTDRLGTCPIWYGNFADGWIVSPEAKAIAALVPVELRSDAAILASGPRKPDWSPYRNLWRLPPGCSLRLTADRAIVSGSPVRLELGPYEDAPLGDWATRLGETLIAAFEPSPGPVAAFISGGIDSSIACSLARRHGHVGTYSLGTVHGSEFEAARELADALDCVHHEVLLEDARLGDDLDRVVFENEVFDGLTVEILLQLSALHAAVGSEYARVVTGYGSDLLFEGMLRHELYMQVVGVDSTPELIERTRWTGELAPFIGWSRGLATLHVFWDPTVIALASRIPRSLCTTREVQKLVLREAAVETGLLSREMAYRCKVGMTDGTQANRLLSGHLGIESPHGYEQKSRHCLERFKRLFSPAGGVR